MCWVRVPVPGGAGAGCCELAVRVVETGCRCWVPVLVPGAVAGCGAGAWCCELAARVVETRCPCWVLVERVRCWVLVVGGGNRVPVLGAGCARGGNRVLEKLAICGVVAFWSQHGCARSHAKAVNVIDGASCEHPYALVNASQLPLGTVKCDQLPLLQPPLTDSEGSPAAASDSEVMPTAASDSEVKCKQAWAA